MKVNNLSLYIYLGDNYIQNFHLGRYIVSFMVGNFVLRHRHISGVVNCNSDYKTNDTPPQMKILNMVIPILMHFLIFIHRKHSILRQMYASTATYNRLC